MKRIRGTMNRYSSLLNSDHFETLTNLRDEFFRKWQSERSSCSTLDEYSMESLLRDGKVDGINLFLKEIEKRSHISIEE